MAGEDLVASKRFENFDFTVGLGWGYFAGNKIMNNPLRGFGSHFDKKRPSGEVGSNAARAADWFAGQDVGIIGGVAWHTPIDGVIVKLDTSGYDYDIEKKTISGFKDRSPWGFGVQWTPKKAPWLNLDVGTQGGQVFSARASIITNPTNWPIKDYEVKPFKGKDERPILRGVRIKPHKASASLSLSPWQPAPMQIGRSARHMDSLAKPSVRSFKVTPYVMNFRGQSYSIPRSDLQKTVEGKQSTEELWHAVSQTDAPKKKSTIFKVKKWFTGVGKRKDLKLDNDRFRVIWETQGSFSEFDSTIPYRTSAIFELREQRPGKLISGGMALRANIADNSKSSLSKRPDYFNPVRSNVDEFADNFIMLENAYTSLTGTPAKDVYLAASFGYLEEMYSGIGADILWRPYASRFAIGADVWYVGKRDPNSFLGLDMEGNGGNATGHVNFYYDVPKIDITAKARIGQYLNNDIGATVSLEKHFDNGVKIEAFVTLTDEQDIGSFGEKLGAYSGIKMRVPIGSIKYIPNGSEIRLIARPFGRNNGQSLRKPLDLYDLTTPLTLDSMARQWDTSVK